MTTMTDALKKVGVTVPHNKRVWNWLKDHPGKTVKEISAALNIPTAVLYTVVGDMVNRKMLEVGKEHLIRKIGAFGPHKINTYRVVGKEFELLPVPKRKRVETVTPPPVKIEPVKSKKIDVDNMSVSEARELYDQLKKIFG